MKFLYSGDFWSLLVIVGLLGLVVFIMLQPGGDHWLDPLRGK